MNVVIIGSEGFIGNELKHRCRSRGIAVTGIDGSPSTDADYIMMDIRSPDVGDVIPRDVDAMVHLAAISRDEDCRANPHLAYDVNILGTLNLMRVARERGVKQFIFASSEWVYGEVTGQTAQTEDQPIDVTRISSEYALSKAVAEQTLRMAHNQGMCPVTILRFGIVYGPRLNNWSAVESLFNAVKTQDQVKVGSLATARRFIHVSDIADGILSAIGNPGFEIFNLSGDNLVTLGDVVEQSRIVLNRHPQVIETDPDNPSIRNPDNRKARDKLAWKPNIDLKSGLATLETVAV